MQGLGSSLPSLTSGKKKSGKVSKTKNAPGQGSRTVKPEANLSATLERLAEQTRHTVESIDAPPMGENIGDDMESFAKQFEALSGSQVLFENYCSIYKRVHLQGNRHSFSTLSVVEVSTIASVISHWV